MTQQKNNDERKVVIELDHVKRNFLVGEEVVHALRGVSFKIYEGEFVTIMGTSGSGKSTLLNQLGCLDTPTSGEYYLDGVAVRSRWWGWATACTTRATRCPAVRCSA